MLEKYVLIKKKRASFVRGMSSDAGASFRLSFELLCVHVLFMFSIFPFLFALVVTCVPW